jgi:hypothetical protein
LDALHFGVVLLLLLDCRVAARYLIELRPQILQYVGHLAACALDVLVKLAALLDRRNRSIGSSKKG